MNTENTLYQLFVLGSLEDLVEARNHGNPKFHARAYSSKDELGAFKCGFHLLEDHLEKVEGLRVEGSKAHYNLRNSVGELSRPLEVDFGTPGAAKAFSQGVADAAASKHYLLIGAGDPSFEHLVMLQAAADAKASVPTIVIYKSGEQITRVVASQEVRVIVLDADGVDLEESAPRVLHHDGTDLHVSDLRVAGAVGSVPYGEQGVDKGFVEQMGHFVDAMPTHEATLWNVPGIFADLFPILESVQVRHWEQYKGPVQANTHAIDVVDRRSESGQFYLTVGALEGNVDDLVSVCGEVGIDPVGGVDFVPSVLVNFDADAVACALYKKAGNIVLRPEPGVVVERQVIDDVEYLVFK
ncbi:hypothetical protein ACRCPS_18305 [Pseudomonas aeruginosa]